MNGVTIHKPEDRPETAAEQGEPVPCPTARVMAGKGLFMGQKKGNAKRAVLGIVVLCAAIAIFAGAYFAFGPKSAVGSKEIQVEIVTGATENRTITIQTDTEYLRQALEEENLIQGDESEFGLFIKTVDGVTADDSKQEWWCVTKNGGQIMTGVDSTPIADGEHYEITLTAGY